MLYVVNLGEGLLLVKCVLISDIYVNLEVFLVVFVDIGEWLVDEIICFGDIIGYGFNLVECFDVVVDKCKFMILGNYD